MYDAIMRELIPEGDDRVEVVFESIDRRKVLGAIADLAESLICSVAEAGGGCEWREMVCQVHSEMLKWVQHLEDC